MDVFDSKECDGAAGDEHSYLIQYLVPAENRG